MAVVRANECMNFSFPFQQKMNIYTRWLLDGEFCVCVDEENVDEIYYVYKKNIKSISVQWHI